MTAAHAALGQTSHACASRAQDWRKAAPNNAVLATSVVAIVVRQGNPKGIRDWDDLTRFASVVYIHILLSDFPFVTSPS